MVSLDKITVNGKALFLAYDQGLEHGPSDFNDENIDPDYILKIGLEGGFCAVIFQKGIAEKYYVSFTDEQREKLPLIVKLNGKTNLVKDQEPYSPKLCTVDEALSLGAQAVGFTVYVGSEYESKMTEDLSEVVRDAHQKGIPVIGWMYPRGHHIQNPYSPDIVAYAARIGLEIGVDMVKVWYPGSLEGMQHVVKAAGKTKVVVSGGKKEDEAEFLNLAKTVMQAGCVGMAVGRNIWQHENPLELTKKLKDIIFG